MLGGQIQTALVFLVFVLLLLLFILLLRLLLLVAMNDCFVCFFGRLRFPMFLHLLLLGDVRRLPLIGVRGCFLQLVHSLG